MQNEDLLEKIFQMQSESNERDARLETQLQYLSSRMDKTENLLEKMSDVLNSQKHLSSVVDRLAIQVVECNNKIEANEKKIAELENSGAKKLSDNFSKVIWIVIPIIVTGVCVGMWQWFKKVVGD